MIVERLAGGLGAHLKHEEDEALAIVDRHATPEPLRRFGAEHGVRIGDDSPHTCGGSWTARARTRSRS